MNNYNTNEKHNNDFKPKSYNGLFIAVLSVLYILLINKIAEIITCNQSAGNYKISNYVMIVYLISILGLVVGFIWLKGENNGNYVLKKSLTFGGIIMLIYTMLNYWEHIDDYAKLIMLSLGISCIIYYAY